MALLSQTPQNYYDDPKTYGKYQFTSLENIINQFLIAYVGQDKIIPKIRRPDVIFHAQRAMQELSFDTFKSCKSQEITLPPTLQMILPQDYVNYTKVSWVDSSGIKHIIYPTSKTSNPPNPYQNSDGDFNIVALGTLTNSSDIVPLDGQYDNILVGMAVSGNGVTQGTTVKGTSMSSNITTVTLSSNITVNFGIYDGVTLNFTQASGDLTNTPDFQKTFEHGGWSLGNSVITFYDMSAGEIVDMENSGVKIGMLVSNAGFAVGTVVTDVVAQSVFVSPPAIATALGSAYSEEITFTSQNSESDTWSSYKSGTPSENQDDYQDDTYWPLNGSRYGLDPQHAQTNGSYYIDCHAGKIHFSSNLSGKTIVLDYISDSLGTPGEMVVHKFAEEAMYKHIAYAILSTRANVPEFQVARFKKDKIVETRRAKLRLSNIKLEEITQILRGKSKQIKH